MQAWRRQDVELHKLGKNIHFFRMHVANCSKLEAEIKNCTTDHIKSGISVFTASLFLLGQLLCFTAVRKGKDCEIGNNCVVFREIWD
jgi:hypothetical protein